MLIQCILTPYLCLISEFFEGVWALTFLNTIWPLALLIRLSNLLYCVSLRNVLLHEILIQIIFKNSINLTLPFITITRKLYAVFQKFSLCAWPLYIDHGCISFFEPTVRKIFDCKEIFFLVCVARPTSFEVIRLLILSTFAAKLVCSW